MKFFNNIICICSFSAIFVPFICVAATESCELQTQIIKAAVKTCQNEFSSDRFSEILSEIASTTLTVDQLRNYTAANCAKINEITDCVIEQKVALADPSCRNDSSYNHAIFSLNHVIRLNLFVCGYHNGDLLEAMIPNNGLKCFYGNQKYVNCVRNTESVSDLPDICANIDVRMNCLKNVDDCENPNAVESFRKLFVLYKEKIIC